MRSLSEAPKYASVIAEILREETTKQINSNISRQGELYINHKVNYAVLSHNEKLLKLVIFYFLAAWDTLWPPERKRQRAFFLFGLALIVQFDTEGIRSFFRTFFRLPKW